MCSRPQRSITFYLLIVINYMRKICNFVYKQTDNWYNHAYTYQQKERFRIKSVTLCWSGAYSPKCTIFGLPRVFYMLRPYQTYSEDKVTELDNSDFMTPTLKNLHNCVRYHYLVTGSSQLSVNYPFSTGNYCFLYEYVK